MFRRQWEITPGGAGRWEWALGPCGHDAETNQERRQIAATLVDLVVATVEESMQKEGGELPTWARPHLAHHAALGVCAHDPRKLRELYRRIEAYRRDARTGQEERLTNAVEEIFGRAPDDPLLRMRRRALVEETLPRATSVATTPAGRARPLSTLRTRA